MKIFEIPSAQLYACPKIHNHNRLAGHTLSAAIHRISHLVLSATRAQPPSPFRSSTRCCLARISEKGLPQDRPGGCGKTLLLRSSGSAATSSSAPPRLARLPLRASIQQERRPGGRGRRGQESRPVTCIVLSMEQRWESGS